MKNREHIKSLFLSDCHLGCKYSKADNLLELLRKYNPDNLF
jgi:UDP-2,3-diacylglucosamine pyrophosphatase LpxH